MKFIEPAMVRLMEVKAAETRVDTGVSFVFAGIRLIAERYAVAFLLPWEKGRNEG